MSYAAAVLLHRSGNTLLYKKVTYKVEDMAAVSLVTKAYYAFVVPAESPASNAKEFVAHAKAKEGGLNYGKVGTGSVTELLPKQVEKITGAKMTGVTFRGTGPAMQEIVGNRLDFAVSRSRSRFLFTRKRRSR